MERTRQEFFARRATVRGRYTGRLDHDPALVERLRLAEWAGPRRPLAVTTLERAARCGYKAFASEVLRIEERTDDAETLDDKGRGHLLHKLLESGQDALRDTASLTLDMRWNAIRSALDEAGAEFSEHESRLDAALLDADLRAVRRQVEAWLERRMSDPDGWQMVESEVAFGPRKKWPALEVPVEGGRLRWSSTGASTGWSARGGRSGWWSSSRAAATASASGCRTRRSTRSFKWWCTPRRSSSRGGRASSTATPTRSTGCTWASAT